jgi:hypothetical protein
MIFDDENSQGAGGTGGWGDRGRRERGEGVGCGDNLREADGEERALTVAITAGGNKAAVAFDDFPADGESEPESAELAGDGAISLSERLEDLVECVGMDAHAGVADGGDDAVSIGKGSERNRTPGRGKLEGVAEKIGQDLGKTDAIAFNPEGMRGAFEGKAKGLGLGLRVEELGNVSNQDVEVEGLELHFHFAMLNAGHVQQIVDEPGFQFDVAADDIELFAEVGIETGIITEQGGSDEDGVQRRAELMAEDGDEIVLGGVGILGDSACLLGGVHGGGEVALGAFSVGDVAGDFGDGDCFSVAILDGRDGDGDVDRSSVPGDAFGFDVFAVIAGEKALDHVGLLGCAFRGNENRDRAANDFMGGVSQKAFGSGVPTEDGSVELFGDDGIVGGFDDRGEAGVDFFGALEFFDIGVGAHPLGDLAGCVPEGLDPGEESSETSIGGAEREDHFKRDTLGDGGLPQMENGGKRLRIMDTLPAPALHIERGGSGVIVPALVVPMDEAIGAGGPGELGDGLDHGVKSLLAVPKGVGGIFLLFSDSASDAVQALAEDGDRQIGDGKNDQRDGVVLGDERDRTERDEDEVVGDERRERAGEDSGATAGNDRGGEDGRIQGDKWRQRPDEPHQPDADKEGDDDGQDGKCVP